MKYLIWLLFCPFLLCCGKKLDRVQEVLTIRNMNDLATVEYVVTKIIKTNDNKTWYKIGDRKILMSCQASIKAGIDFSALKPENITINGDEISLQLPPAKMISLSIRPEDISVQYEDVGVFRQSFSQAEKDLLLSQGEEQIKSSIASLGVLNTAETNASVFLTQFLKKLGYKKINIRFGDKAITQPVG
ncbi:DUF4230 domain-containing protein [Pollutibacter soli]|uniref:DUF4230 domain-containing protein n=1 Tax=Pollutibacter soli TaxID=3034157 RepID=UPI0030132EE9